MKNTYLCFAFACILFSSCKDNAKAPEEATTASDPLEITADAMPPRNPDKNCYFGNTHLHSTLSFDAYNFGSRTTPDETYIFDSGGEIDYLGMHMQRKQGLDFTCLTDHSEYLGINQMLIDTTNALSKSPVGILVNAGTAEDSFKAYGVMAETMIDGKPLEYLVKPELIAKNWQYEIDIANKHNKPGKYTTIHSYEWTSAPGFANMHRNVFFRGDKLPKLIFSALDSQLPEDLWTWMEKQRTEGIDVFAISHNGNISNGLMYPLKDSYGNPLDLAYAERRNLNEPLTEMMQTKGTSETHPKLSPNDEFANFELFFNLLEPSGKIVPSKLDGSYIRQAFGRGLEFQEAFGGNPFKMGVVGGTDMHSGMTATEEYNFPGSHGEKDNTPEKRLNDPFGVGTNIRVESAAALTGVWAEENTRDAIFDAIKRKEVFATSGQLMKVRVFGGWDFDDNSMKEDNWVKKAYEKGVPMGGDLPVSGNGKAPSFIVQAIKDPNSGNLDRIQVIKVSLVNGKHVEKIYNVVWSGDRKIGADGKLPAVGNTVDVKNATYTNTIGAAELSGSWTDPDFDATTPACYYIRVLEIPVPRWTTYDANALSVDIPKGTAASIQERAWSSPIWYTPKKS